MSILVTGATGNVGRHVVGQLAAAGHDVRALTRRTDAPGFPDGVRVVRGDLADPETLGPALDGVTGLYLFPVPATAREVLALARTAGVRKVAVLSSGSVDAGLSDDFNLPVEQAAEQSGLAWTHLRPGEFMTNSLLLWGPSIRAERTVRWPFADLPGVPVHEADIAAVAVAALTEDGHAERIYRMTGPKVSPRDQVRAIAAAIGEDITFEVVPPQEASKHVNWQDPATAEIAGFVLGFDPEELGFTREQWADHIQPLPTIEEVTGRPARSYEQWARDHADDFR